MNGFSPSRGWPNPENATSSGRGGEAQLLQDARGVVAPALRNAAVHDAIDGDGRQRHDATRRGVAEQLARVRAAGGDASDDAVAFGDEVLDDVSRVGEGTEKQVKRPAQAVPIRLEASRGRWAVVDIVLGVVEVDGIQVAAVDLRQQSADDVL